MRNVAYRLTSKRHWRKAERFTTTYGSGRLGSLRHLEIYHDQEQIGNRFDATFRAALGGGVKNELVGGFDVNRIDFKHINNYSDPSGQRMTRPNRVDPFNYIPGRFINLDGTVPAFDIHDDAICAVRRGPADVVERVVARGRHPSRPSDRRARCRLTAMPPIPPFEKGFSDVTWRAGAVYTPIRDLAFYGQYATGVDTVGGVITLGINNSPYQLATGRQIEVGVKQSFWEGRGEWTVAAYDIVKRNLLSPDPTSR